MSTCRPDTDSLANKQKCAHWAKMNFDLNNKSMSIDSDQPTTYGHTRFSWSWIMDPFSISVGCECTMHLFQIEKKKKVSAFAVSAISCNLSHFCWRIESHGVRYEARAATNSTFSLIPFAFNRYKWTTDSSITQLWLTMWNVAENRNSVWSHRSTASCHTINDWNAHARFTFNPHFNSGYSLSAIRQFDS